MFSIALTKSIGPGGVPFLFHSDTVRGMIEYIQTTQEIGFSDWFQQECRHPSFITEFYLYSGYVKFKYGNIREMYSNKQDWECVNLSDHQIEQFDEIFKLMEDRRTLTVSIKAKAWSLLNDDQKLKYVTLLRTKNIVDSIEDALEQLNTVVID